MKDKNKLGWVLLGSVVAGVLLGFALFYLLEVL